MAQSQHKTLYYQSLRTLPRRFEKNRVRSSKDRRRQEKKIISIKGHSESKVIKRSSEREASRGTKRKGKKSKRISLQENIGIENGSKQLSFQANFVVVYCICLLLLLDEY